MSNNQDKKKPLGYNGKILHIDLSNEKIEIEEPDQSFYRTYLGGSLLGTYYVTKLMPKKTKPLDPANVLVFAPSIITGVAVAGASRFTITAKSPLTGAIGDTQCGGDWGPKLKHAGYDAIVLKGKAEKPVYISIIDGEVKINSADNLWGLTTGEAYDIIKDSLGDKAKNSDMVLIGTAGEKMVKHANITGGLSHFAGRTGMGAVMGSKNLKAIIVSGKRKYDLADNDTILALAKKGAKNAKAAYAEFSKHGTPLVVEVNNNKGNIVSKNFTSGAFDGIEELFSDKYGEKLLKKTDTCWGCPVGCKRVIEAEEPYKIDPRYGGPEFETIIMFGSNLGINNLYFVGKANEICNKMGMDTITTGGIIGAIMDAYENNDIPQEILEKYPTLKIKFGNEELAMKLIKFIAKKEDIGEILAEGPKFIIEKLGKSLEKYFVMAKNQPFPAHMPRVKPNQGLIYAVNSFGADHMSSEHDWIATEDSDAARGLGIIEFTDLYALDEKKIKATIQSQIYYSLMDTLTLCDFVWGPGCLFDYEDVSKLINAITGWKTTFYELMKAGERRINLMRFFNINEGITSEMDKLPPKMFKPLEGGKAKGRHFKKTDFKNAISKYYSLLGWDEKKGIPYNSKLEELGINWLTN